MLSAALSWFDRQRPTPKHAEERALPAPELDPDWPANRNLGDDRRLFDEAGAPVRIPGDEHPSGARPDTGRWEAPHGDVPATAAPYEGLLATLQGEYTPTPTPAAPNPAHVAGGYADGGPVPAREPIVAGQFDRDLAATKRQADWPEPPDYGRPPTSVGQITVAMDQEIAGSPAAARGESLALERRLRRAAEDRYAVAEAARVKAEARVAELELVVKSLAKNADTATDEKGGE